MKNILSIILFAFLFTQIACKNEATGDNQATEEATPKTEMTTTSNKESEAQEMEIKPLDDLSCSAILENLQKEIQMSFNDPKNFTNILNKYETHAKAGIECKKDDYYLEQFDRIKKKAEAILAAYPERK